MSKISKDWEIDSKTKTITWTGETINAKGYSKSEMYSWLQNLVKYEKERETRQKLIETLKNL